MKKGNPVALLPIAVFLLLFIGSGLLTGDFYAMPAVVGFLIALVVAFLQNPKLNFQKKLTVMAKGAGDENIMVMCLIFLLAGAFSASVKAAGGVESTVNFGLSILPGNVVVAGIFLIACFISISMGTSVGTIAALAPIAVGICEKTGIPMALCVGAVVCGAMFGDNLSMISDTTIAAVRTQGCQMKDKFRENFRIVLPAAVVTVVIFLILAANTSYQLPETLTYHWIKMLPYLAVLIGALAGVNVFLLLTGGTVLSLGIGLAYGDFAFGEVFGIVGSGIEGMYEITVISILVAGVVALVRENGGIAWILQLIHRRIKSRKGAETGIAALSSIADLSTANNTVAIVIAGPLVREISGEYGITPRRSASLLDIFTSVFQGLLPYGAQLLSAAQYSGLTPFALLPYLFYPMLMAVSAVLFIVFQRNPKPSAEAEGRT